MRILKYLSLMVLLTATATLAVSGAAEPANSGSNGSFFDRRAEGWFWYIDPILEEEEERDEEEPQPPPAQPLPRAKVEPEGPPPLSVEWIREQMPKYMDRALNNPTPENVRAYYALQRIAMDKANAFADVAEKVVLLDPQLDETVRRPIASFGARTADLEATRGAESTLREIGEQAGIWFFFRSDCPYCMQEAPILDSIAHKYGITVQGISVDGGPLVNTSYETGYLVDSGQAEHLGVFATPAIFLVNPKTNEIIPLGQGLLAGTEIERRILLSAHMYAWISDEQFNRAQAVQGGTEFVEMNNLSNATLLGEEDVLKRLRGEQR